MLSVHWTPCWCWCWPQAVGIGAADPNNPTGSKGLILVDKRGHYVRFFDPKTREGAVQLSHGPGGGARPRHLAGSQDRIHPRLR